MVPSHINSIKSGVELVTIWAHDGNLLVNNTLLNVKTGWQSYRGRVEDGEAKRKLGLIVGCGLATHLCPPLPSSEWDSSLSARSPSYNNEFPWSADMLLNIH